MPGGLVAVGRLYAIVCPRKADWVDSAGLKVGQKAGRNRLIGLLTKGTS